ncbi:flagellar hook-basal body complex protein FliE [Humidesulfovibrio mexicanus]|jgi:flagellar hook-basal body complex protein FliE|uniref:Flagellar hook-basal body complex protein FliE n=1 Tax=Humidesulfovibrio mexicanus TaxID=147047 RepID=A0A239AP93_9BACT|nr:flagellar hook-basal body complex protein FliE [Humidesulfovibrio mexicanus]SNR97161.1 flagellar hook-basal body complex protein FliE [Humidesulfovibrio mexicanus]
MIVKSVAMQAYQNALKAHQGALTGETQSVKKSGGGAPGGFMETLKGSLSKVNDMQQEKTALVESFAAGKDHNVHELMISLQKAGLAMSMTSAVRSKILASYQELTKMQF